MFTQMIEAAADPTSLYRSMASMNSMTTKEGNNMYQH
jgi:hypothetical protein